MTPRLEPSALSPFELRGTHFRAGESVHVLVLGGGAHAAGRVTAAADGSWTLAFPDVDARNRPVSARAQGDRGSAAIWAPRPSRLAPAANRSH